MDVVDHGAHLARSEGPFVTVKHIMRHRVFGVFPNIVETIHLLYFFCVFILLFQLLGEFQIACVFGFLKLLADGVELGIQNIKALCKSVESSLRLGTFDGDVVRILCVAFEVEVFVVGEERHRTAPLLEHDGIHLIVGTNRGVELSIPVLDDCRVEHLAIALQIDGLSIGVGKVHLDIELRFFVACTGGHYNNHGCPKE